MMLHEYYHERTKEIDKGYHDIKWPKESADEMKTVADLAQRRDRSDPFVFNRAMNYLRQGLLTCDEIRRGASI